MNHDDSALLFADAYKTDMIDKDAEIARLTALLEEARAENATLREALTPMERALRHLEAQGVQYDDDMDLYAEEATEEITVGDLRRARALLGKLNQTGTK